MRLIDIRTKDGSREFVRLPGCAGRRALRDIIQCLDGTEVVNFSEECCDEAWLKFTYCGHEFSARDHGAEVLLVVRDPQCSDVALFQIAWRCELLLGSQDCEPVSGITHPVLGTAY